MAESDSDISSVVGSSVNGTQQGPKSLDQSSMRSRGSRFSRLTKESSAVLKLSRAESKAKENEEKTKSIFEWNGGGRNVYIAGSWDDFKEKIPMESLRPGSYRIVLPIPATEQVDYIFFVDGQRRVATDLPSIVNEAGNHVNIKHGDPTVTHKAGRVKKILSKISGLDLYSPFQRQKVASMIIFRLFYILTFPAAAYYFYWLIIKGGNKDQPFIWITYIVAEFMSISSAVIGLFSMWSPIRRRYVRFPHNFIANCVLNIATVLLTPLNSGILFILFFEDGGPLIH